MGGGERMPCLALLVSMAFALSVKLSLNQPFFLTFKSLPHPTVGSEWAAAWFLVAGKG